MGFRVPTEDKDYLDEYFPKSLSDAGRQAISEFIERHKNAQANSSDNVETLPRENPDPIEDENPAPVDNSPAPCENQPEKDQEPVKKGNGLDFILKGFKILAQHKPYI